MKFKYYGTAAAEAVPAMFCECDVCKRARAAGGRNIRTRSQALVDDCLLIDFPADTVAHVLFYGLDLTKVTDCLVTHSHSDHLYAPDLEMRKRGFAHFEAGETPPVTFYSSETTGKPIVQVMEEYNLGEDAALTFKPVEPFVPFNAGKYTVVALPAQHAPETDPYIYIISDGKSRMLYANDTGYFLDKTWEYLERERPFFDFVSLDCTGCTEDWSSSHMGLPVNVKAKERLIAAGCGDAEHTIWCCHHFSHNGHLTYDEFVPVAKKEGFLVSYDTMELEF